MPNKILTSPGWEGRIRSKLGVDAAYLPDADLQQPEIIDIAEANIIDMVPSYASMTGSDRVYLEAATVCECAILACPSMPARLPAKEQGPHVTYELDTDWTKLQAILGVDRDGYLTKIVDAGGLATVPHFGVISWRG